MAPLRAEEMTFAEYERAVRQRVVVWPVGILEEHGPHLPLGTDTYQVEAVVDEACEAAGAVVLPTLFLGNAHSTQPFPGTISITEGTLERVAREVLAELERHGARAVCVVSGHAGSGHMHALRSAGKAAAETTAMEVAVLSEWDLLFDVERPIAGVDVPPHDGHGGAMETARMMHLRPDLVEGDAVPGDHRADEHPFILPHDPGAAMPDGYGGDPSLATPELGGELHKAAVEGLVELFADLAEAASLPGAPTDGGSRDKA